MIYIVLALIFAYSAYKMYTNESPDGNLLLFMFIGLIFTFYQTTSPLYAIILSAISLYLIVGAIGKVVETKIAIRKYKKNNLGPTGWRMWAAALISQI